MVKRSLVFTLAVAIFAFLYFQGEAPRPAQTTETFARSSGGAVSGPAPESADFQPELEEALRSVGEHMYDAGGLSPDLESDLSAQMRSIGSDELSRWAISLGRPEFSNDERRAGIYLLSLAGAAGAPALALIAAKPVPEFAGADQPHSNTSLQSQVEVSLRVMALNALDEMARENQDVRGELQKILQQQNHPTVRMLAQISWDGVAQGRPGKLQRLAEELK